LAIRLDHYGEPQDVSCLHESGVRMNRLEISPADQGGRAEADKGSCLWPRKELLWFCIILAAGLLPRLIFIRAFPTHPISDFAALLSFSISFRDDWLAKNAPQWRVLSPGLPLILSLLLRLIPKSPETVGRWATAISTGLVPAVPYILWKGTFRLRTRVLSGLILALWPGQILFSSVLAQDNWIIFPSVAITVLAVRLLVMDREGAPILAALLYATAVAIREEMLFVLLPVAILAAAGRRPGQRLRNLAIGGLLAGLLLGGLIIQRGLATGRYTLSTEHLGTSVLGAYIPQASLGWASPIPYLEAEHPEVLQSGLSESEQNRAEIGLAWQEFLRRPTYQSMRITGSALTSIFELDSGVIRWSLTDPAVLPEGYQRSAKALKNATMPVLQFYPFLVQILFAFSVFFASGHGPLLKWISPMLVPIALKFGLHALIVSQARYFLVIVALELLTIAIASEVCFNPETRRLLGRSLFLGALTVLALYIMAVGARDYVWAHDEVARLDSEARSYASCEQMEWWGQGGGIGLTVRYFHVRIQKLNARIHEY
jgi:hypothetical protein